MDSRPSYTNDSTMLHVSFKIQVMNGLGCGLDLSVQHAGKHCRPLVHSCCGDITTSAEVSREDVYRRPLRLAYQDQLLEGVVGVDGLLGSGPCASGHEKESRKGSRCLS